MTSPLAKLPPPLAWAASFGIAAVATWLVPALQPAWFRSAPAAWGTTLAALAWSGWAMAEFRRHRTTILPQRQPTSLLCRGPFRFSRNPLYLAMLALTMIPWLARGQIGLSLAPLLFFAFANWAVIPSEEAKLHELFGDAYADYCRRVRRWC